MRYRFIFWVDTDHLNRLHARQFGRVTIDTGILASRATPAGVTVRPQGMEIMNFLEPTGLKIEPSDENRPQGMKNRIMKLKGGLKLTEETKADQTTEKAADTETDKRENARLCE